MSEAQLKRAVIALDVKTVSEANARGHWSRKAKRMKLHRYVAALVCLACATNSQSRSTTSAR